MELKKDIASKEADQLAREMLAAKYNTTLKKVQFVNELKTGLGAKIKANPNRVKIIKKSWLERLGITLKTIFTKF